MDRHTFFRLFFFNIVFLFKIHIKIIFFLDIWFGFYSFSKFLQLFKQKKVFYHYFRLYLSEIFEPKIFLKKNIKINLLLGKIFRKAAFFRLLSGKKANIWVTCCQSLLLFGPKGYSDKLMLVRIRKKKSYKTVVSPFFVFSWLFKKSSLYRKN